ncbi:MAG: tetratricopeptide repeat protein [Spirochaetota bacterium]
MKILFTYVKNTVNADMFGKMVIPSEIISLASYLENECDTVILNKSDYSAKWMEKRLHEIRPDMIYIHIYTHNRIESLKLLKDVKKVTSVPVIIGGPFVTFLSGEIAERYQEADHIIRGEPEILLERIIIHYKKKQTSSDMERILHIDRLSRTNVIPPANEFEGRLINVNPNEQFKYLLSSRGSLSDDQLIPYAGYSGGELRPRSVRKTVSEIVNLQKRYGTIYYIIRDDDFLVDRERAMAFCRELSRRKIYIMWQCNAHVKNVDEQLLNELKLNGLERIKFNIFSGSPSILKQYAPDITQDNIRSAVAAARRIGLYVSIRLFTGFPEETYNDIRKTHALIQKTRPGYCEVVHLSYYPGTVLYNDAVIQNRIQPSIWFRNTQPAVYVRDDPEVESWIDELKNVASTLRYTTWYTNHDFRQHRRYNHKKCWVTDILEGDYYYDEEQYDQADRFYRKVITAYPNNPWGYLRMGKVKFTVGSFASAEQYYQTVQELIPEYYGSYLKMAQALVAQDKIKEARRVIEEAFRRNRFDPRIQNVRDVVRH